MELISAVIEVVDDKHFIKINIGDPEIRIPLSDDKAIAVKAAFNRIISRIRLGEFQIQLVEVGEDLFSQVANEYLIQLNREIKEVRSEMETAGLVL